MNLSEIYLNSTEVVATAANNLDLDFPYVCFRLIWGQRKSQSVHLFLGCAKCSCQNDSCKRKSCLKCSIKKDSPACWEMLDSPKQELCERRTELNFPFRHKNHATTCVLIKKIAELCEEQKLDHNIATGLGCHEHSKENFGAMITITKSFKTAMFAEAFLKNMFGNIYLGMAQK